MESKVDIWMPLAIGDYLADTSHLDTTQHGAYLLLLMHYWRKGPLPNDAEQLANICRLSAEAWAINSRTILPFFKIEEDGMLHQKRQDAEREKALNQKRRGVAGAQGKWCTNGQEEKMKRSQRLAEARKKGTHTAAEWELLQTFCRHQCVRCQASDGDLVKDHIVPIYQGGSDSIDNIQPLCRNCNASKGPETIDYRPNGWQNACKMPTEMPTNVWTLPLPSQLPSPKEKELPEIAKNAISSSNGKPLDDSPDFQLTNDFEFEESTTQTNPRKKTKPELDKAVREVFAYYLDVMNLNPSTYTLTPKRRQKGFSRLSEALRISHGDLNNAVELMKGAVDELATSDWHMGRDERTNGKRYCDWENHLFRNTEQFEKWLQQAQDAAAREVKHV